MLRRPNLSPLEELHAKWLLQGQLHGHTAQGNFDHFRVMAAAEEREEARLRVLVFPDDVVTPAVEPTGLWGFLRRRR
jgi:hypothetical protein